ncbi:MAG TPA: PPC domain-containing protein, partial [Caulifigura sp.]|nr:PPC domain-containing protein [Caulifigura sp.]
MASHRAAGLIPAAFALGVLFTSAAQAAPPTLTHLVPPGGQRGTTVTVKCQGKFDWPVAVSAPGVQAVPGKESGQLEITIPDNLAADRIWLRLHNAEGATAAAPFLIGSVQELAEKEPNNSPETAHFIEAAAVTVNGVYQKSDVDSFAVHLEAGQTLVAALDANTKLGSPVDAVLQVVTDKGFVLAENHDDVGLDPRLTITAPSSGRFIVRTFAFPATPDSSIQFFGNDTCIYRLTLTTGPFITHTAPLSAPLSEPGQVDAFGWNISPDQKLSVVAMTTNAGTGDPIELEPQGDARLLDSIRPGLAFSPSLAGVGRLRLAPFPALSTVSLPADSAATPFPVPGAVTGRLSQPREIDRYQLTLAKGQKVLVLAEGSDLDFPVEPVLKLTDPKGAVVATLDEISPKKTVLLNHTAAQDGIYELTIRDRYRTGGERSFYQLSARIEEPDFELTMSAESLVIPHDKPAELTVNVVRRGNGVGPITISATGLPDGIKVEDVTSDTKGDTASKVKLKFTTTGPAFSGAIRVTGQSNEPVELRRSARP